MSLFPSVKQLKSLPGFFDLYLGIQSNWDSSLHGLIEVSNRLYPHYIDSSKKATMVFIQKPYLVKEGYQLTIEPNQITVLYADYNGALYALITLSQLIHDHPKNLPCVTICDHPDLPIRGVMLDISRDKIPTLKTLKELVWHLSTLKFNHFQLYVEGFSLEYPSFPDVTIGETPFLLKEFEELETYCHTLGMDLVGNMNGFGHMSAWLARQEFHELAECPDGFVQWGYPFAASTLNPSDERSLSLVKTMYDDLLSHSRSPYFNICGDEPFELGRGKSKERCEKHGLETIYLDYILKLIDHVHQAGKTPMMWGDVLINHPESVKRLPKDLLFIDWGYDRDYPFEAHGTLLESLKIQFVTAPGTSSWNSFSSRFEDMRLSTLHAAQSAKKHGGLGVLTTDWGDNGHLQYLPWSYLGFAYAAMVAWTHEEELETLQHWLNQYVYHDCTNTLAGLMMEVAKYNDLETQYQYNSTTAFNTVMYVDSSDRFPFEMRRLGHKQAVLSRPLSMESCEAIKSLILKSQIKVGNITQIDPLLKAEIEQTLDYILIGVLTNRYFQNSDCIDLKALVDLIDKVIIEHERLWRQRNKIGGLNRSLSRLITLKQFITSQQG